MLRCVGRVACLYCNGRKWKCPLVFALKLQHYKNVEMCRLCSMFVQCEKANENACWFCFPLNCCIMSSFLNFTFFFGYTTRKLDNTNRITDRYFSSVIFNNETNFISKAVGISRWRETFFESCNDIMTWIFFRRIYRQKYRGIQTRIADQWRVANTGRITEIFCRWCRP